ncbi:hypothetical protein SteCoe_25634 [Stentor coeruleus]|uniref:PH domain-containing protein n=1 Tax=Stentor coeruleus TaxID=5963 RepID=A0A1R2BF44_9CILI|nr:hypothetical protein SteCoe_25634 [Stentor coeruleus]
MIDEESIEIAFSSYKPSAPPEDASPTKVSETFESISGWLRRKPIHGLKKWEWRYFTLAESKLKYYLTERDITPSGVFNFNQLTGTIATIKTKGFVIDFHSCQHRFFYKAQNEEDKRNWLTALHINMMNAQNTDKIMNAVSMKENFWKYERVSDYWFQTNANTGDLIFFQAKAVGAKIQRNIGRSSFDHIAMVLCYSSGKIGVFEVTSANGVALVDWDDFHSLNWIDYYTKIVYRRLEVERSEFLLNDLQKFVNSTSGKSFGFSAKKIITRVNKKAGQEQDFFCSELVASAYKAIGLLPADFKTTGVFPMHFEKDDGLPLRNATLGPLLQIDFDL